MICLSASQWGGDYAKTIVEVMKVFARKNKVLYIDYPYTLKDLVFSLFRKTDMDFNRIVGIKNRIKREVINNEVSVYVFVPPPIIPVNYLPSGFLYSLLLRFNGYILSRSVKQAIRKLEMEGELIYFNAFLPSLGEVTMGKFDEKTMVYYCYDEINSAKWLKKHGGVHEKHVMLESDIVLTTSEGLYQKKKAQAKRCFLVKNAVNFELFRSGVSERYSNPEKIIGYIGSIDERLDYDLLKYVISHLPEYKFEFVGRCTFPEGRRILEEFSNVSLTGPKNSQELPGFISRYSAGIIPFAINDFNFGIYPLKINEYLAGGLPVVMTNFALLNEFRDIAFISGNEREFVAHIRKSVSEDSLSLQAKRIEFARQNSWESRVDLISDIIASVENEG